VRRRPYLADRDPVTVRRTAPDAGNFSRKIRNGSRRKECSVPEYQGNDETAAVEEEEVVTPAADTDADQRSPGSMEDAEAWED
jgi:hypothetical protein